jgi:hypothetical protein
MVGAISDPALREALARELGVELRGQPPPTSTPTRTAYQSPNWTAGRGNGSALD